MRREHDRSFEELAVPHLETVYRVALRLSKNAHEAEDLVQETYLKACKAFARFELRDYGIRPWLLRILHNTFFNRSAREARGPKAIEQEALEQVHGDAGDGAIAPPKLDFENVDAEVKNAIDGLAPEFRSVMLLWATMEFSYQEIADIIEIPIGTVMSRLHRARQSLVKQLDEYARMNRLNIGSEEK